MEGGTLPFLAMVIVQVGYAGMNILSKLAMDSGMNPFVHVAYRQIFASIVITPFAYFLERLESVGMKRKAGQAKILGTVVCVGGAMLLSFYHGHSIHWKYADDMGKENSTNHHHSNSFILGPFLIIASTVSWAIWFIIQGTVCTAVAFCLMSWCIQRKGPLYVSVFSPLLLIIVAILSWALLEEKLYVGTVVGSGLIVMGLYAVLWGKNGEMNVKSNAELLNPEEEEEKQEVAKSDLEIHFFGHSNGNFRTVRI